MILCRHNSGTDIDESMIWAYDGPMGLWAYDNLMSRDVSRPKRCRELHVLLCMARSVWVTWVSSVSLSRFPNGPKVRGIIPCPFHVPSMFSRKLQETESQEHQMEHRKSKHAATNIMV